VPSAFVVVVALLNIAKGSHLVPRYIQKSSLSIPSSGGGMAFRFPPIIKKVAMSSESGASNIPNGNWFCVVEPAWPPVLPPAKPKNGNSRVCVRCFLLLRSRDGLRAR